MNPQPFTGRILALGLVLNLLIISVVSAAESGLQLHLRSRVKRGNAADSSYKVVERKVAWDPKKTAIIICDMWDDHWCKGAARRVAELAGPMNEVVTRARARGMFVIHSPSSVVKFYENTPQRKRAQNAPFVKTKAPLATAERWGTAWCWPDSQREADLPIDDSDMGCECPTKCTIREAWTRQISTIEIAAEDAITDNGQETCNLLAERGIENVILMGVHLNMCVLGRPFGIRQMVNVGKNVAFIRDMTDTMYNHEKRPKVSHFQGTALVVEHIEKYWCPSFTSADITGGKPFRFKEDTVAGRSAVSYR
jgi:nicotinamidase-related amidase